VLRKRKLSDKKMPEVQKVFLGTGYVPHQDPGAPKEAPQRGSFERQLWSVQEKEISLSFALRTKILTRNSGTGYAGFARF
jgi:hypothetical protein